jgi:hypothetical protein
MYRAAWLFFIVTGALTMVTLFVPALVIMGLMLLVVPGLILVAAPPLFMYGLIGLGAWKLSGIHWSIRLASAITAIAAVAVLLPHILNQPITDRVSAQKASDKALAAPTATVWRLALLRAEKKFHRDIERETDCGELCQRLLFNGAVDEILLGTAADFVTKPTPAQGVTRYRVERRDSCPAVKVPTAGAWQDEKHAWGVAFSSIVSDRVKARIADGECLIAEQASLANADAVVVDGKAYESAQRAWDHPWNPWLVSVRATRVSAFAPSGGPFTEIYRHTSIESEPLLIPFMATAILGRGFNVKTGLVRTKKVEGAYELRTVLRDAFKLDLSIPQDISPETVRRSLMSALADPALTANHPRLAVADVYLKSFAEPKPVSSEDVAVVRALIGDRRIRNFLHLGDAIRRLGPEAAPLAALLLDRIMASQLPKDRDIIQSMSTAIGFLPEGTLAPVMDQLRLLAADERRRGPSWRALSRLADGGAANTVLLVTLTHGWLDARSDRRPKSNRHDERDTSIGAVIGLCLLGEQARPAVPALLEIVNGRSQNGIHGVSELALIALDKIGAAGEVAEILALSDKQRRHLEWRLNQARRDPARACYSMYS